jgi:hypothetical protein
VFSAARACRKPSSRSSSRARRDCSMRFRNSLCHRNSIARATHYRMRRADMYRVPFIIRSSCACKSPVVMSVGTDASHASCIDPSTSHFIERR